MVSVNSKELYRTKAIRLFLFAFVFTVTTLEFMAVMFWTSYEQSRKLVIQATAVEDIEGRFFMMRY